MSEFESNRIKLVDLAEDVGFEPSKMSEAEKGLFNSIATGEWAHCGHLDENQRTIRSKLFEWLLCDPDPRLLLHRKGVRIEGAIFKEEVNLEDARIDFPLDMQWCTFKNDIVLRKATTRSITLSGSKVQSIYADSIDVKGSVIMRGGFKAEGEVRFPGAVISGQLDCTNGKFRNLSGGQHAHKAALCADCIDVKGSVFLCDGFQAEGEVRFPGSMIGGQFNCSGGKFRCPGSEMDSIAIALNLNGIEVKRDVYLQRGFYAEGEVSLIDAVIGGQFSCVGGKFKNPADKSNTKARALTAAGIKVQGDVLLGDGFESVGEVMIQGAIIGGQLDCTNGKFNNPAANYNPEARALTASGIVVKRDVNLLDGFKSTGMIVLTASRLNGRLNLRGADLRGRREGGQTENVVLFLNSAVIEGALCFVDITKHDRPTKISGRVMLRHTSVGQLIDSPEVWEPKEGVPVSAALDGFTYNSLGLAEGVIDIKFRKRWIERGAVFGGPFAPQPYTQLAHVLHEAGHESKARQIFMARERARLKRVPMGKVDRFLGWLFGWTVGHGYRSRFAVYWLLAFWGLGFFVFFLGWQLDKFNPAVPFVYNSYYSEIQPDGTDKQTQRHPWPYHDFTEKDLKEYPAFRSFVYSLDTLMPMVNLHQESYWMPTGFFRGYMWFHITAGWFFTTMAVVGFTGLIRKE